MCASILLVWYLAHVWFLVCGCNKHQKHTGYDAGSDIFDFSCQIRARLSHIRVDWLAEFQSFKGCMETLSNFFFASQSVSIAEWTSKSLISSVPGVA